MPFPVNTFLLQAVLMSTSYFVCIISILRCNELRIPRRLALLIMVFYTLFLPSLKRVLDLPQLDFLDILSPYYLLTWTSAFIALKGTVAGKICFNVLLVTVANFCYIMMSFLAELVAPHGSDLYFVIWFSLSFVCLMLMLWFVYVWGQRLTFGLLTMINSPVWNGFVLYVLIAFLTMRYIYITPNYGIWPLPMQRELGLIVLPFFLTLGVVASSAAVLISQKRAQDQLEIRLAHGVLSAGYSYYEKMARTSQSAHDMRADMRHHLLAMQNALKAGDVQRAREYLSTAQAHSENTKLRVYCSSPIINALLDSYESRCQDEGIKFSTQVDLPDQMIDEYELCIILGNLLENAATACVKTPEGEEKYIDLNMCPHRREYGIMVRNSFDGVVCQSDQNILSTKPSAEGRPGIGIQSIRTIAGRYNGFYRPVWSGHEFSAYVVLRTQAIDTQPFAVQDGG